MTEPSSFLVSSAAEAAKALDYFNGFHDGFMKRINIISSDEIDEDRGQSCTGLFEVGIDFAHYNYQDGTRRFIRTISSSTRGSAPFRISSATFVTDFSVTR